MPSACPDSAGLPSKPGMLRDGRHRGLVVIALYKFVKMAACVLLAAAAFDLVRPEVAMHFEHWLESLTWATRQGIVMRSIDWLLGLGPKQFRIFGAAAAVYAALYAVQGFGLWFSKRWAEYLVVIETCLLLPFESLGISAPVFRVQARRVGGQRRGRGLPDPVVAHARPEGRRLKYAECTA